MPNKIQFRENKKSEWIDLEGKNPMGFDYQNLTDEQAFEENYRLCQAALEDSSDAEYKTVFFKPPTVEEFYQAKQKEIEALLIKIQADILNQNYKGVNWGHIGSAHRILELLKEVDEFVNGK